MDEIDREIRETLAIQPSPEFLARVRTEIAKQPIAPRVPWLWAMGVACLAIVVVAVGVSRRSPIASRQSIGERQQSMADSRESAVDRSPVRSSSSHVDDGQLPASNRRSPVAPAVAASAGTASRSAEPPMPEVLISPDDARAFQQFITSVREGRLAAPLDGPMPSGESYVATDLAISPIIIEPLETPSANN